MIASLSIYCTAYIEILKQATTPMMMMTTNTVTIDRVYKRLEAAMYCGKCGDKHCRIYLPMKHYK